MNPVWQAYLHNHQAIIENNCVIHFGNIPSELQHTQTNTIITDLSHFDLIRFSGNDARVFLQSQLTCDIHQVSMHSARYGSYCTAKGRILTNFTLWQQNDDVIMELPANLSASILKRFNIYVLRAKVKLSLANADLVRIGLAGTHALSLIQDILNLPLNGHESLELIEHESTHIICLPQQRFELITSIDNAPFLWERLSAQAKPVGIACWNWLTIQAGIPIILAETQEMFLPQMINLDVIGGISFKKGCYPGQEIVARTHYLGTIKRRMHLAHIDTAEIIEPGDILFSENIEDQSCGTIVNVAPSPQGGFDVLAVIQQNSLDCCTIHWKSLTGPTLELMPLPYSLSL